MREGISIEVNAADRQRLAAVVADRNSPQKHCVRARNILATAEGCGTAEIMRQAGVSKPCVWRRQNRFRREGMAGLLRDKTIKPGLPPVDRVVALTLGETIHWTGRGNGRDHRHLAALGAADLGGASGTARPRCSPRSMSATAPRSPADACNAAPSTRSSTCKP